MEKKRVCRLALSLMALTAVLSAAGTGGAANNPSPQVSTIDNPLFTPRGLNGQTTVVVQLSGNSVAEAEAAAGRKLAKGEKQQLKDSLKARQDSLKGSIEAAGGTVLDQFQSAINGIKVEIAAGKADQLKALPNVVDVLPVATYTPDNDTSVPYIGAPQVWNGSPAPNLHGEGIKIGIIDTGIDYTHANFGGPGTPLAYQNAFSSDTLAADPTLFGALAPKVKGGYDFVGDAYTGGATVPQPDPNPLDCAGHGSHVAGTAAGFGVTGGGATYTGSYNSSIYGLGAFTIGPGVAPKADLYAYRVFGCAGSTNVVVDAIDRAVDDGMDVINMSLGSPYGTAKTADSVASSNAAKAGVIVVASAGNSGPAQYITGTPAAVDGAISVAANDAHASFPGVSIHLSTGPTLTGINANEAGFADGTVYNVRVLPAAHHLGCNGPPPPGAPTDYPLVPAVAPNTILVVDRGTCARVAKAIYGQMNGAAAVVMVNNAGGLPPLEGPISVNPDTRAAFVVTIPFFGVPSSGSAALHAADGGTATVSNTAIANPGFSGFASFTSGGPRNGDSVLKPDVTAPGVSTFSTAVGTGNGGLFLSGTSMAAPHTAGLAALVRQAHPSWTEEEQKAAIVDTASASAVAGFNVRLGGAGLIQALPAVQTNATAVAGEHGNVSLSFGYEELPKDLSKTGHIKVRNRGGSAVTFNVSVSSQSGVPHTLTPKTGAISVPANGNADLEVKLTVPAASVGDSSAFHDLGGIVNLTPTGGGNNGVALHVPYYLVARALSDEDAKAPVATVTSAPPSTTVTVANKKGAAIAGSADFYAWGIHDDNEDGHASNDVRDVGVQAFPNGGNPVIVFGINTYDRWSSPSTDEFDIGVDVDPQNANGDDYVVFSFDFGAITTGSFTGQYGTFVASTRSSGVSFLNPAATYAPTDSATMALPILASQLCRSAQPCLNASNPRFTYHITGYEVFGAGIDTVPQSPSFNAFSPSISTGAFLGPIAPGSSASTPVAINPAEWAQTPALGELVLTTDNKAGGQEEAQEVPLTLTP